MRTEAEILEKARQMSQDKMVISLARQYRYRDGRTNATGNIMDALNYLEGKPLDGKPKRPEGKIGGCTYDGIWYPSQEPKKPNAYDNEGWLEDCNIRWKVTYPLRITINRK